MLQMKKLSARAHQAMVAKESFPPPWEDMASLEEATDDWIVAWLESRQKLAHELGFFSRLAERIDRKLRTDDLEYLDDPDYPVKKKVRIVKGVNQFNILYRSYPRYVRLLTPLIQEVAEREARPARLLELASGSGDLAMEFAKHAEKRGLPVAVTGSDYIPAYVEEAATRAEAKNLPVSFRLINGFEMRDVDPGEFDIILISGSTHHFSPGQLAMMIAQSRRAATTAFVSIDGRRGLDNFLGLVPFPTLTLQFGLLHDAILSGRKFYSQYELEHIARIAAPGASVTTKTATPMSILTVRFD